ncbi:hypothetical protein JXM83_01915 [Candidatus Woesearchaeota archaeon]|nr:hypothetical protein [Candidatus Woesearchaeota archaeon]
MKFDISPCDGASGVFNILVENTPVGILKDTSRLSRPIRFLNEDFGQKVLDIYDTLIHLDIYHPDTRISLKYQNMFYYVSTMPKLDVCFKVARSSPLEEILDKKQDLCKQIINSYGFAENSDVFESFNWGVKNSSVYYHDMHILQEVFGR